MRPLCLVSPLLLLLACGLPANAAPAQPSNLRPDILYTTKGEFVQVSPMRPLTLNAHVTQFAYDPLGLEVAYVGSEVQGDQTVYSVKTMDTRTGHEMSRLSVTDSPDSGSGFILLGWSVSGKYLLLQRFTSDPQDPSVSPQQFLRWDLSASPPVTRLIDPAAHLPAEAQAASGLEYGHASPHCRWMLFKQHYRPQDVEGKPALEQIAYVLYDPDRDAYRLLALPPGASAYRWSDDAHLRIQQKNTEQDFDVVSGQVSTPRQAPAGDLSLTSKHYPDLTLDVENRPQSDLKGTGGHLGSYLLWVRRMPAGKQPLGAAAAGLTPGYDDPQAVWSPTGKQIAFLSHEDLYVTDLAPATGMIPHEKMAVGLTLTCAEERHMAESNLKQIGLALMQYAQDADEHYPPKEGVNDAIYPYLKTRDVFQVGSHHFVYQLPANASLASIEAPAETPQGMMDLPCARVVLFADGHVKSFPKQAPGP